MINYWDGEDGSTPGYPDLPAPPEVQVPPPVAAAPAPAPTPDDQYPGHELDPGTGQWVPVDPANPGPTMGPYPGYSPTPNTPGYPGGGTASPATATATTPDPATAANPRDAIIAQQSASWKAAIQQYAASKGVPYDDSMLQDVVRQVSYAQNAGQDPAKYLQWAYQAIDTRASNKPGAGTTSTMSNFGTPPSSGFNFMPSSAGSAGGAQPMSAFGVSYAGGPGPFTPSVGAFPMDLLQPFDQTFQAPDPSTIKDSPLVQSRINLGLDTMQKGAAGKGTLLTPGFQKSIADYAGDVGSEEYWNLYNAAAQEFQNKYSNFEGDQTRRANTWLGAGNFDFGALTGLTQLGQGQQSLDENARMDTFGMNRANTMDAFNVSNTLDTNYYDRLFKAAQLGLPQ